VEDQGISRTSHCPARVFPTSLADGFVVVMASWSPRSLVLLYGREVGAVALLEAAGALGGWRRRDRPTGWVLESRPIVAIDTRKHCRCSAMFAFGSASTSARRASEAVLLLRWNQRPRRRFLPSLPPPNQLVRCGRHDRGICWMDRPTWSSTRWRCTAAEGIGKD